MTTPVAIGVVVLLVAAAVVLVVGGLVGRAWRSAAELALTFVLAAGSAALTGSPGWPAVAVVAGLVGLEALVHRKALQRSALQRRALRSPAGR